MTRLFIFFVILNFSKFGDSTKIRIRGKPLGPSDLVTVAQFLKINSGAEDTVGEHICKMFSILHILDYEPFRILERNQRLIRKHKSKQHLTTRNIPFNLGFVNNWI